MATRYGPSTPPAKTNANPFIMSNASEVSITHRPAEFGAYLNAKKIRLLSAADHAQLVASAKFLADAHANGAKYSEGAANAELGRIAKAAEENPTAENLQVLSTVTSEGLHARFEKVRASVGRTIDEHKRRFLPPIYKRALAEADKHVVEQIERVIAEGKARSAEFGSEYAAENDPVVTSLRSFRVRAKAFLGGEHSQVPEPDVIRFILGTFVANNPVEAVSA